MKITKKTSVEQLATLVCEALLKNGISAVLTGGAVVSIYSHNEYESRDLDFITSGSLREVEVVLNEIGFKRKNRIFVHPLTEFYVEFPPGPLAIGDVLIKKWDTKISKAGRLQILSPTHAVMDRLAAYFYWNDRQSLDQAVLVAKHQPIRIKEIEKWASNEGQTDKFQTFRKLLSN